MHTAEELKLARDYVLLIHDLAYAPYRPPAPADPRAQWAALVASKEAAGLSRVAAIRAAAHEQPALYRAQSIPAAQFRASR